MEEGRGWYSRGYLPHIDLVNTTQFMTWRLKDALPPGFMARLYSEIENLQDSEQKREKYRRIETMLDAGSGSQLLRESAFASQVQQVLHEKNGQLCLLHAFAIMPTHVHALLTPLRPHSLADVMKHLKGSSSRAVNKIRGSEGSIWEPESFDRYIRDEWHFLRVHKYIEWNPVKAKLCTDPKHWPYSSAYALNQERLKKVLEKHRAG
jgi:putative transposase